MNKLLYFLFVFTFSCMSEPKKIDTAISPKDISADSSNVLNKEIEIDGGSDTLSPIEDIDVEKSSNQNFILTLEKLINKSQKDFEIWAIENGYVFDKVVEWEYFDVIYYRRGNESSICISVTKSGSSYGIIIYETADKLEYESLKEQCENIGYKYLATKKSNVPGRNVFYQSYTNGYFKLNFNIAESKESLGYSIIIDKTEIK